MIDQQNIFIVRFIIKYGNRLFYLGRGPGAPAVFTITLIVSTYLIYKVEMHTYNLNKK